MQARNLSFGVGMLLAFSGPATAQPDNAVPVALESTDAGWVILRSGEPYFIRGAGGWSRLELLAKAGGNSIRTWGPEQLEPRTWPDGKHESVLDRAHRLGLTVTAGFWIEHPSHGFDYDDDQAVEEQLEALRGFVLEHRDHPALLMWGIGNEVAGPDQARCFKEIDRAAKLVKALDPNHLTMTATAGVWPSHAALFAQHCPNVDVLGVNVYGGLPAISQEILRQGYSGPYVVTEFGPVGHWESSITPWGAPIEQSSTSKAEWYRLSYELAIAGQRDRCLGSYAFLWGQKQETTATWYGMFLASGEKLGPVDAMSRAWTGRTAGNLSPRIESLEWESAHSHVGPASSQDVSFVAVDPEGRPVRVEWLVKHESSDRRSGGAAEQEPQVVESVQFQKRQGGVQFVTPSEPGAYRLFVFAFDDEGGAATANLPFYVRLPDGD